jgi:peptidoglycan hydrolase-like protein with peptidoglycan-binding domain
MILWSASRVGKRVSLLSVLAVSVWLLTGTPANGQASTAPAASAAPAKTTIQAAQKSLLALGYQPGAADGVMGAKVIAALKKFQADHSLPVTGQLDRKTLDALDATPPAPTSSTPPGINAPKPSAATESAQAQAQVQVKLVPYTDVGWSAPSSGEEIMEKIKSASMGMITFFAVTKGPIVTFVEEIYVVNANDRLPGVNMDLEAGRLAIKSTSGNAMAETGNGVSFVSQGSSAGSGVQITSVGTKGFVFTSGHPVLPVGTEFEIGKIRWQNTDFDEGIITLRADGIEWRPKPE